jgi:putative FmdB family regulatory protein
VPLYEFGCDACGKKFEELFRSMNERRKPRCPHCKSGNVHKMFSTFATAGGESAKGGGGRSCGSCAGGSCATCH